ncbi:heavy-metal-associated domain-containing protein [Flavobacterium sp.]|jgi:copper chaperone CopZ|uniref:heavy-metal-associated domain-containing protein n=1 Tax=Flavobacterium sp. TaxID=239 RepID=UPI0037C0A3AE
MKNIFLVLFTLFTFTLSAQNSKNEKAVIKTNIYCDHCKACETCGQNFQENLYKITGLKMYELDEKAMTLTIYYNGKKTTLNEIKTAITKLGYDADEMKADTSAYDKLDDCCKKV